MQNLATEMFEPDVCGISLTSPDQRQAAVLVYPESL